MKFICINCVKRISDFSPIELTIDCSIQSCLIRGFSPLNHKDSVLISQKSFSTQSSWNLRDTGSPCKKNLFALCEKSRSHKAYKHTKEHKEKINFLPLYFVDKIIFTPFHLRETLVCLVTSCEKNYLHLTRSLDRTKPPSILSLSKKKQISFYELSREFTFSSLPSSWFPRVSGTLWPRHKNHEPK